MGMAEDGDLSPQGIDKCIRALHSRTAKCDAYLQVIDACGNELAPGGVCGRAKEDGEEMPCLILRTKPEELSAACAAALPKKEEEKGLKKFWADGKRFLSKEELKELDEEAKDVYSGWKERKNKKTDKTRERDYAVKVAKRERATKLMTEAAATNLAAAGTLDLDSAISEVKAQAEKQLEEDLTGTLKNKPFKKKELETIAKAALKAAKAAKKEL